MNILVDLFVTFLKIGTFAVGGGPSMIPLIEKDAVFGSIFSAFVVLLLIAMYFVGINKNTNVEAIFKGIRPAVVALLAVPVLRMGKSSKVNKKTVIIPIVTVILVAFFNINAILPLIRQEVGFNNLWLRANEFTDLVAISQASPGPIAINGATYVGYRVGGFWGSVVANLGGILPTFIIMLLITKAFIRFKSNQYVQDAFSGILPATVGLIASAAVMVSYGSFIDYKSILICAGVFIGAYKYEVDPIVLIIICGVLGFVLYR